MKKKNISLSHLFSILGILIIACSSSSNRLDEQSNQNANISEQKFKMWLNDTIPSFKNWEMNEENFIVQKTIKIATDSLSLESNALYSIMYSNGDTCKGKVVDILMLLKEYNEVPKNEFKLSFNDYVFYFPSAVEQLRYESLSEFKDIKVEYGNKQISYEYIRGRLSSKETRIGDKREYVEFIWEGDRLIKQKQ